MASVSFVYLRTIFALWALLCFPKLTRRFLQIYDHLMEVMRLQYLAIKASYFSTKIPHLIICFYKQAGGINTTTYSCSVVFISAFDSVLKSVRYSS